MNCSETAKYRQLLEIAQITKSALGLFEPRIRHQYANNFSYGLIIFFQQNSSAISERVECMCPRNTSHVSLLPLRK